MLSFLLRIKSWFIGLPDGIRAFLVIRGLLKEAAEFERVYGYVRDLADHRDALFDAASVPIPIPATTDLEPLMPPVYDQGQLGSCTANAIAGALEFLHSKEGLGDLMPSRLQIYYNERAMEGTVNSDSGAQIRDGIKCVNTFGVCHEELWPYVIPRFKLKPSAAAIADAKLHPATSYQRLTTVDDFRACLASGYPVVMGFSVPASFESAAVAKSGVLVMPLPHEQIVGGHAVTVVGHDDAKRMFKVRNSWGAGWGIQGYFWMPYDYITKGLASDFWTLRFMK